MIPLRDDISATRRPYVTYALIGVCLFVYIHQFFNTIADPSSGNQFILRYGMIPAEVVQGRRLATLVTSMFLHGGILHILGNMLYLWIFGDNVEDAAGHLLYLGVYLLSGVLGSGLHILVDPLSTIPTVGASGAISGTMGAYMVLYPRARVLTLVPIFFFLRFVYLPASLLLGFWILLQLLHGCGSAPGIGGVAYFAHIGGFGVGVVCGLVMRRRRRRAVWYDIR